MIELIHEGIVDTSSSAWLNDGSFAAMMVRAEDLFVYRLLESGDRRGEDEDHLYRLEGLADEYMPTLIGEAEPILLEMCHLLSNLAPPPEMRHPRLDKYVVGYSTRGNNAGFLHFQFIDP